MSQGTAPETPEPRRSDHLGQKEVTQKPIVKVIGQAGLHDKDAVKIGLWGPPLSGKTTFLAALPIAVSDGQARNGSWIIYPHGTGSWDLLERFEKVLVEDRRFPESTPDHAPVELKWEFVGDLAGSRFDRRRLRRGELESRFVLDLIDVYGGAYRRDPDQPGDNSQVASAAIDHLTESQGIIYLFDPIGERDNRDSAAYVRGTVNKLLLQATENGRRPGRYLPHQVSVCITKFDHPELFHQARKMNLVTYGDDGMPRVRDRDAEQFFDELCTGKFWSKRDERGQQSAQFVRDKLRQVFRRDNIHYFVTSSIGFWMEPPTENEASDSFNLDDFVNVHDRDGKPSIRGKVRPINVLEPLISLQQRITRG